MLSGSSTKFSNPRVCIGNKDVVCWNLLQMCGMSSKPIKHPNNSTKFRIFGNTATKIHTLASGRMPIPAGCVFSDINGGGVVTGPVTSIPGSLGLAIGGMAVGARGENLAPLFL